MTPRIEESGCASVVMGGGIGLAVVRVLVVRAGEVQLLLLLRFQSRIEGRVSEEQMRILRMQLSFRS